MVGSLFMETAPSSEMTFFDDDESISMISKSTDQDDNEIRNCMDCGTDNTPQWRAGPHGPKTLCNKCGIRWYRQTTSSKDKKKDTNKFPKQLMQSSPTAQTPKQQLQQLHQQQLQLQQQQQQQMQQTLIPQPKSSSPTKLPRLQKLVSPENQQQLPHIQQMLPKQKQKQKNILPASNSPTQDQRSDNNSINSSNYPNSSAYFHINSGEGLPKANGNYQVAGGVNGANKNAQYSMPNGNTHYPENNWNNLNNYEINILEKGLILAENGQFYPSIDCFDKVLQINPYNISALMNKASSLHDLDRYPDAVALYDKVLQMTPQSCAALVGKAICYYKLGQYYESIKWCDKTLYVDRTNIDALNYKGASLDKLGQYNQAMDSFDSVLRLDNMNVIAMNGVGECLYKLKKFTESVEWCDRVLQIYPHDSYTIYTKGSSFHHLERYKEALECFDQTLQIDPSFFLALNGKGTVLERQGKTDEAIWCYENALQIEPNCGEAHYNKARLLELLMQHNTNFFVNSGADLHSELEHSIEDEKQNDRPEKIESRHTALPMSSPSDTANQSDIVSQFLV